MTTTLVGYVDPQMGSFFFQLMIGGLIGGAMMFKQGWRALKEKLAAARALNRQADSL